MKCLKRSSGYETRRAGLGKEFAQAVDEIISRIVDNPLRISGHMRRRGGQCCRDFHMPSITGLMGRTSSFRRFTDGNTSHAGNLARFS